MSKQQIKQEISHEQADQQWGKGSDLAPPHANYADHVQHSEAGFLDEPSHLSGGGQRPMSTMSDMNFKQQKQVLQGNQVVPS
jgi:hypothetical protein